MRYFLAIFAVICVATVVLVGFRGKVSKDTPVYIFDDMDYQSKYKPMGENHFFEDGRNDRPPVPGVIARGDARGRTEVFDAGYQHAASRNAEFVTGKNTKGEFIDGFPKYSLEFAADDTNGTKLKPYAVDERVFELGRQKFEIFCAVCHGHAGNGEGILKVRNQVPGDDEGDRFIGTIANLQLPSYREKANGDYFNTITNGKTTMQPYGDKLSPEERWAVIAYLRALQLSQNCPPDLVPASIDKANLK
ncbi:MAG: cytochrome c [Puniceicoccales bacterium]|jgi:mono/diheme cytochrome c family protein|nr:cytochrome c [Puniceicoccales bacterium]